MHKSILSFVSLLFCSLSFISKNMIIHQPQSQESQQPQIEAVAGLQGWHTQAMGKFQTQYQAERSPFDKQELGSNILVAAGIDYLEGSAISRSIGGEVQLQPINESDTSTGLFSHNQGTRKDDRQRRTLKVHVPQNNANQGLLDDGFSWRKYGQKDILGSKYPRGYYRCTHRILYNCRATKQVQRMDDDPYVFEVTYRGSHTCHKSSTVPSIGPLPSSVADQISPDDIQLSMGSLGSGSLTTVGRLPSVADQKSSDFTQLSMDSPGRGSFMTVGSGSSSGPGLPTAQSLEEVEYSSGAGLFTERGLVDDWASDVTDSDSST